MTAEELKKLNDQLYGAANRGMVGGLLGMPVDVTTQALGLLGYHHPRPVGGSEWIGEQMQKYGLVSPQRYPVAEQFGMLATTAPLGVPRQFTK